VRHALVLVAWPLSAALAVGFAYLGAKFAALAIAPPPCGGIASFLCFGPGYYLTIAALLLGIALGLALLGAFAARGVRWARFASAALLALTIPLLLAAAREDDAGVSSMGLTPPLLRGAGVVAGLAAVLMTLGKEGGAARGRRLS
jgi:hypothetical protein